MITVESYTIQGWGEQERGMLIAEDKEWVLVKHIPVDYVIDGFKLYRKVFIESRTIGKDEQQISRVLALKEEQVDPPDQFQFGSLVEMLKWSERQYGVFELQDYNETELFYGTIHSIQGSILIINNVTSQGIIEKVFDYEFSLDEIRVLTFETDYFHSIRLLMKDNLKAKKT